MAAPSTHAHAHIPIKVVDLCRGAKSPLTGGPVHVVAAGGIFDGRGLAMAMCHGAQAAWVGTRFVASKEGYAHTRMRMHVLATHIADKLLPIHLCC